MTGSWARGRVGAGRTPQRGQDLEGGASARSGEVGFETGIQDVGQAGNAAVYTPGRVEIGSFARPVPMARSTWSSNHIFPMACRTLSFYLKW
jgi:hypothetical protein